MEILGQTATSDVIARHLRVQRWAALLLRVVNVVAMIGAIPLIAAAHPSRATWVTRHPSLATIQRPVAMLIGLFVLLSVSQALWAWSATRAARSLGVCTRFGARSTAALFLVPVLNVGLPTSAMSSVFPPFEHRDELVQNWFGCRFVSFVISPIVFVASQHVSWKVAPQIAVGLAAVSLLITTLVEFFVIGRTYRSHRRTASLT